MGLDITTTTECSAYYSSKMGIGASSTQSEVQKLLREITFENKAETLARLRELKASGAEGSGEMKYELMKRASALERETKTAYDQCMAFGDIEGAAKIKGDREALLDAGEILWPGEFRRTDMNDTSVCIVS